MIIITKENTYAEWEASKEQFLASTLPNKGYSVYLGVWPLPAQIQPFQELKDNKKQEISNAFDNSLTSKFTNYTTQSLSINITINARERDLNNLEQLEKYMIDSSVSSTNFRCFDNLFVNLSLIDVSKIVNELRAFGLYLYQQKWVLESTIDSIVDDTEENRIIINSIGWNF